MVDETIHYYSTIHSDARVIEKTRDKGYTTQISSEINEWLEKF